MDGTPLTRKLGMKPGYRSLVLNAPEGYTALLEPLPEGGELDTEYRESAQHAYDLVLVFTQRKADLDKLAPAALSALKKGGVLWFAYPKKSSRVESDLTRDENWTTLNEAGLRVVSSISIDTIWSGLRFRPVEDVKSKKA